MNIAKNMEAIFILAAALTLTTSFAVATPSHRDVSASSQAQVPSLVISAKRLSDAEKAALE